MTLGSGVQREVFNSRFGRQGVYGKIADLVLSIVAYQGL